MDARHNRVKQEYLVMSDLGLHCLPVSFLWYANNDTACTNTNTSLSNDSDRPAPRSDPDHPAQISGIKCQVMTLIILLKYPHPIGLRQAVTLIILHNYPYSAKQWLWSACTNTHISLSSDRSACAKQCPWTSCTNTVPSSDTDHWSACTNTQHARPYPSAQMRQLLRLPICLQIYRIYLKKGQL